MKNEHINITPLITNSFLIGNRDTHTKLWTFDLQQPKTQDTSANTVYEMKSKELIHFQHKALYSPTKATWLQAIKKGLFSTWHGVNFKDINKH